MDSIPGHEGGCPVPFKNFIRTTGETHSLDIHTYMHPKLISSSPHLLLHSPLPHPLSFFLLLLFFLFHFLFSPLLHSSSSLLLHSTPTPGTLRWHPPFLSFRDPHSHLYIHCNTSFTRSLHDSPSLPRTLPLNPSIPLPPPCLPPPPATLYSTLKEKNLT